MRDLFHYLHRRRDTVAGAYVTVLREAPTREFYMPDGRLWFILASDAVVERTVPLLALVEDALAAGAVAGMNHGQPLETALEHALACAEAVVQGREALDRCASAEAQAAEAQAAEAETVRVSRALVDMWGPSPHACERPA